MPGMVRATYYCDFIRMNVFIVISTGYTGNAANYLTSQYTLNDIRNKMDEVMMTNAHAQVKLPSLRIKRRNVNILVDGFRRQRNRANIKHQDNVSYLTQLLINMRISRVFLYSVHRTWPRDLHMEKAKKYNLG